MVRGLLVRAVKQTQFRPARKRERTATQHLRLLGACQALPVQIGMSRRIRVDNLLRAIVRDLHDLDRFVRS